MRARVRSGWEGKPRRMADWVVLGRATEGLGSVVSGREIREATTGRVIAVLPRVWATASETAEQVVEHSLRSEREQGTERKGRPRTELAFYRKYTEAMLRRYGQMRMERGRVPSMLGREMFRGKVTSYRIRSFEDAVIFRLDVERCLATLSTMEMQLIRRIALQEYTQGETAGLLGMSLRGCVQKYGEALDRLTAILLERKMLEPLEGVSRGEEAGRPRKLNKRLGIEGSKKFA